MYVTSLLHNEVSIYDFMEGCVCMFNFIKNAELAKIQQLMEIKLKTAMKTQ